MLSSPLTFQSFVWLNPASSYIPRVIKHLEDGGIIPIMVTGDSIFTGLCIARECNLIRSDRVLIAKDFDTVEGIKWVDESGYPTSAPVIENLKAGVPHCDLAMMGFVWERILHDDNSYALTLLDHVRVYGRCTPNNKTSIISTMISKGYITMMCGDGGNDCGALRMAHVGIALSDSEASMVSPFTSLEKSITSVIEVLREGRCALASAFATYKYIILVSKLPSMVSLIHYYMLLH
jgi:cation-transporting ATPase 13A3/4/5